LDVPEPTTSNALDLIQMLKPDLTFIQKSEQYYTQRVFKPLVDKGDVYPVRKWRSARRWAQYCRRTDRQMVASSCEAIQATEKKEKEVGDRARKLIQIAPKK